MFVLVTNWKYCWSALHSLSIYIKNDVHWQLRKEFAGFKIFYQWKMDSDEQLNCFCMSRIKKRWLPSKYIPWMVLCTNLGLEWEKELWKYSMSQCYTIVSQNMILVE